MNAADALKELELIAWEIAEAERHERAAKKLRVQAVQRLARHHAVISEAKECAERRRPAWRAWNAALSGGDRERQLDNSNEIGS